MISFSGQGILLDIEGTTSSVRFVYDVLFPFARERAATYLQQNWKQTDVQNACAQIAKDAGTASLLAWTGDNEEEKQRQAVIAEVYRLMDGDVKATGLKELQGLIWREGYLSGQLCSHVFPDVPSALKKWHKAGKKLCIYSSGSVTAQKLFFAHTEHGDLTEYFHGYFDTTTGPKKEASSYTAIAAGMQLPPGEILFISDVIAELEAAQSADMKTALSLRPDNTEITSKHPHDQIRSFEQIQLHARH